MFLRTAAALVAAALLAVPAAARADQDYAVSGDDTYRIGDATTPSTQIVYSGSERLRVQQNGRERTFRADARYTRRDRSGKATVRARFVQALRPSGSFEDRDDRDPDFLTVLNQPFAVQLDAQTMAELHRLTGSVPFRASSPLGADTQLSGSLRRVPSGAVHGHPVVGVRFVADGPMNGPLPQHPETSIAGRVRMEGTAYYGSDTSLLLALDATLTITGKLQSSSEAVPVRIVYRRRIKADDTAASWTEANDR